MSSHSKKPARWRKIKPSGLLRTETHQLWRDGERLATVARAHDGSWYFYAGANGRAVNSLADPIDGASTWPLAEAKATAQTWVRLVEAVG